MNTRLKNRLAAIILTFGVVGFLPFTSTAAGQAPSMTTLPATEITNTGAKLSGYFDAHGTTTSTWFVYGTTQTNLSSQSPVVNQGTGTGPYTSLLTALAPNTTYYYRAVGSNFYGTTVATAIYSFTTTGTIATNTLTLQTIPVSNISDTSIMLNGFYTSTGTHPVLWFQYGTSTNNLNRFSTTILASGTSGPISITLRGLTPNTTYYFKMYGSQNGVVTNAPSIQTATTTHTTQSLVIATLPATAITSTSADLNSYANVSGGSLSNRHFVWGTSAGSLSNTLTLTGTQTTSGAFSATLSGLTENTNYYFKACGTGIAGVICSTTVQTFTTTSNGGGTQPGSPIVSSYVNSISQYQATLVGTVNSNGATTTAWFEYGYGSGLGSTIGNQTLNASYSSQTISSTLNSLSANSNYSFRVCASNNYGQNCSPTQTFTTTSNGGGGSYGLPIVSTGYTSNVGYNYATANGTYDANGNAVTTWFEYGRNYTFNNSTSRTYQGNGSGNMTAPLYNLDQNTLYTVRACAQNNYGTNCGNQVTFTTGNNNGGGSYSVTTTGVTNVGKTFATLNGYIASPVYGCSMVYPNVGCLPNAQSYFQWGGTTNLGFEKSSYYSSGATSATINGLTPGTTYYFRLVSNQNGALYYGDILNFTTLPSDSIIIVHEGGDSSGHVVLTITPSQMTAHAGDTLTYTVTYQNTTLHTLKNMRLQIMFPSYVSPAFGAVQSQSFLGNTLDIPLENLAPGATGSYSFNTQIHSNLKNNTSIVVTGTLSYTNVGVQENVIAYGVTHIEGNNFLLGLALFGGGFWPHSFAGWLILLIVVLLIIYFARRMYTKSPRKVTPLYTGTFGTTTTSESNAPQITRTPLF
jgi:hypothetical protein